ncbi:hypothetical protein ACFL5O_10925 [Myxococcota bacterium]
MDIRRVLLVATIAGLAGAACHSTEQKPVRIGLLAGLAGNSAAGASAGKAIPDASSGSGGGRAAGNSSQAGEGGADQGGGGRAAGNSSEAGEGGADQGGGGRAVVSAGAAGSAGTASTRGAVGSSGHPGGGAGTEPSANDGASQGFGSAVAAAGRGSDCVTRTASSIVQFTMENTHTGGNSGNTIPADPPNPDGLSLVWVSTGPKVAPPVLEDGPRGCGQALRFSGDAGYYRLDDFSGDSSRSNPEPIGAIEFWLKATQLPEEGDVYGIVSRDLSGRGQAGHLNVVLDNSGHLRVRGQREAPPIGLVTQDDSRANYYLCSEETLDEGEWIHVGINFSVGFGVSSDSSLSPDNSFELYINGQRQANRFEASDPEARNGDSCEYLTALDATSSQPIDASAPIDFAPGRNRLPWVLGASWASAKFGADTGAGGGANAGVGPTGVGAYFTGGAIDEFVISAKRRDFRGLEPSLAASTGNTLGP